MSTLLIVAVVLNVGAWIVTALVLNSKNLVHSSHYYMWGPLGMLMALSAKPGTEKDSSGRVEAQPRANDPFAQEIRRMREQG
jgi:hypothetical protein